MEKWIFWPSCFLDLKKKVLLVNKNKDYKHNGDMLDQAEQMAQNDLNETDDELAPGTQQT